MKLALLFLLATTAFAANWERCANCERDEKGAIKRSMIERNKFRRETKSPKGRPGEAVDHLISLACATSPEEQRKLDTPANMQWLDNPRKKLKDRREMMLCGVLEEIVKLRVRKAVQELLEIYQLHELQEMYLPPVREALPEQQ